MRIPFIKNSGRFFLWSISFFLIFGVREIVGKKAPVQMLNASFDTTRELYTEINRSFIEHWKKEKGVDLRIDQSHGGSGKQARSVMDGMEADVVTLALSYDVDLLAQRGAIEKNWQSRFPHRSTPFSSAIVLLVRKGNPKKIKDWGDLARKGISVITPNPKTSGGARWNYLAAWAWAEKHFQGNEKLIRQFMSALYHNVPVLDNAARASSNTFMQRNIGDVLIAWESEAKTIMQRSPGRFELIIPSLSVLTEPPVALVDGVTRKRDSRELAYAYLNYLYSEEAQKIAAQYFYRPSLASVKKTLEIRFAPIETITIDEGFGGWEAAQKKHFSKNGEFDGLFKKRADKK